MRTTHTDRLLCLAVERQIVRTRDARALSIPSNYLGRLVHKGLLKKVRRGIYASPTFSDTENATLVEAASQLSKGVVCLLSALRFHDITTQSPREVWMAIGQKSWAPKSPSISIRFVRMSGQSLSFGVKEYETGGTMVHVFNPAKTVADCFKFRNKIGLDIAIEALRESLRRKKASMDELWAAAKVCRVANVMRPYMEFL
jgi:predicted transcriptional regulator of viral defense system